MLPSASPAIASNSTAAGAVKVLPSTGLMMLIVGAAFCAVPSTRMVPNIPWLMCGLHRYVNVPGSAKVKTARREAHQVPPKPHAT
jgi:hypothetical protein